MAQQNYKLRGMIGPLSDPASVDSSRVEHPVRFALTTFSNVAGSRISYSIVLAST